MKNAPQEKIRDRFRRISPLLAIYKKDFGYYSLIVTDIAGRVLENIGDTSRAPLYVDTAAILQVVSEKKTKVVDFYRCPACGRIHLDVLVPVFKGDTGGAVAGVVVLRRDPANFLFPLIQSWPTPSKTSETLLFRREGDSIVFLNELRHKNSTALKLKFSVNEENLPAARVALGQEGFMEGTDYRGVKVFAVGRHIPDSPWYIIAKVDKEEVLAPLLSTGRSVIVMGGLGVAIIFSLLVMWWMAYDRTMLMARHKEEMAREQAEEGLRQSEELYRSTLDTMMEGCQIIGFDWRYLYVNEVVARQGHCLANEFVGRTMMECYPGIEATSMFEVLRQCMKDRQPRQMENEFVYPDGATAYFQLAIQPNPEGIFILSLDITERKRAEEALRANEAKYRSMIIDLSEGFYSVTLDGKLLDHNREFNRILGFGPDENLIGIQLPDFWQHPADRKAYLEEFKKHGRLKGYPIAAKKRNGELIFVEANARLVRDLQGTPAHIEGSFIDVTERKRVEDALQQSEKRLSEAQKMAQLGHWEWDIKTGNVEWSDEIYHIFQLDPKNFIPQIDSILAFSPWPEDHERDKELIRKAMESREKGNYVQRFLRPDKSTGYYHSTFQGKYDNEGNLISIVGTILDITDRKRTEQEIVRLNNDLLQKNAELEQLVFVASHDLRSPLVNVQGFSKEMGILVNELAEITSHACLSGKPLSRLTDILTKEFPESQNYVLASVIKMDMLLKGLLKLSRLGRAAVAFQEINMDDMISGVIKTLEFQIQQCGARMELSALPACIGDPVQVNQVFTNLIDNAIKFLSPDRAGIIRIFGKSLNGMCEYCVEDNGIGIAPEHQLKVFEIFHRLDPQMSEGEGLGLAIVKKIVSRLNGDIRLESELGKGSRFVVSMPEA